MPVYLGGFCLYIDDLLAPPPADLPPETGVRPVDIDLGVLCTLPGPSTSGGAMDERATCWLTLRGRRLTDEPLIAAPIDGLGSLVPPLRGLSPRTEVRGARPTPPGPVRRAPEDGVALLDNETRPIKSKLCKISSDPVTKAESFVK